MKYLFTFLLIFVSNFPIWAQDIPAVPANISSKHEFCLLEALPENTLAVFGFPNISAAKSALKELHIAKLLQEKEVQNFLTSFEPVLKNIKAEINRDFPKIFGHPLKLDEIQNFEAGQIYFALVNIVGPYFNKAEFVLSIENPELGPKMLNLWKAQGALVEEEIYDVQIAQFKDLDIFAVVFRNTLLLSNEKNLLVSLVKYETLSSSRLTHNPEIQKIFSRLVPQGEMCVLGGYVNLKSIFNKLTQLPQTEQFLDIGKKIGLLDIQSLAFSINFANEEMHTNIMIHAPNAKGGIHKCELLAISPN